MHAYRAQVMAFLWVLVITAAGVVSTALPTTASAGVMKQPSGGGVPVMSNEILQWLHDEQEWIAGTQLANGAFPTGQVVQPYHANIAAAALVLTPEAGQRYGTVVQRYLDWYLTHLEIPDRFGVKGTIYDYTILSDGSLTAKNDYDSSDSYAATFLRLVHLYVASTSDLAYAKNHLAQLRQVAEAALGTLKADGLTWAKPSYHIKYVMDNAEVYQGLQHWVALLQSLGQTQLAEHYTIHLGNLKAGIEYLLWQGDHYAVGLDATGRALGQRWTRWYPDATAQIWPIITGLIPPESERALTLWETFNAYQPSWVNLAKDDPFPWTATGYAAALVGDYVKAVAFAQAVHDRFVVTGKRQWTWHPAEAGNYVFMLYEVIRQDLQK